MFNKNKQTRSNMRTPSTIDPQKEYLDPRKDFLGFSNIEFFLKKPYTKDDYYSTPIEQRKDMLDWSAERWNEYCVMEDYFDSHCIKIEINENSKSIYKFKQFFCKIINFFLRRTN